MIRIEVFGILSQIITDPRGLSEVSFGAEDQFCSKVSQYHLPLGGHILRHHNYNRVPLLSCEVAEGNPSVAAGGLDNSHSRPQ